MVCGTEQSHLMTILAERCYGVNKKKFYLQNDGCTVMAVCI
jgi:hypothetical protein